MPVMDEFKKEREAMKNGTPKQKLAYFWDYYKWHVIISVIVLVTAVSFIYQAVTRKSVALYALLLNANTTSWRTTPKTPPPLRNTRA